MVDIKVDECPICLENKPLASLKPCSHEFCVKCVHQVLHDTVSCPLCRETFTDCSPPLVVFDSKLDSRITTIEMEKNKRTKKYGIGIVQRDNRIVVSSVEKYRKTVKINQFVVGINNLPCYNKNCFIDILNKKEKNLVYFSNI